MQQRHCQGVTQGPKLPAPGGPAIPWVSEKGAVSSAPSWPTQGERERPSGGRLVGQVQRQEEYPFCSFSRTNRGHGHTQLQRRLENSLATKAQEAKETEMMNVECSLPQEQRKFYCV